jgi:hypothetical protein
VVSTPDAVEAAHSCPKTVLSLDARTRPLAPTPAPSSPGLYGPFVLSNPSTKIFPVNAAALQEQSAQVKVVAATSPAQGVLDPVSIEMTGPEPPAHFGGAG